MEALIQRLKSKTYALAIISAVIGVIQAYPQLLSNALQLTSTQMGYAMIAIGIAGAVIRELTTKPLSEK